MSVKLTDAQLVMMSAAAQRDDRCMAPDTMKGAALTKVSDKLIKLGFVREIRAKAGMPVWHRDDAGQGHALKLTAAGLKAIAVDEAPEQAVPIEAPRPRSLSEPSIVSEPDNVGEPLSPLAMFEGATVTVFDGRCGECAAWPRAGRACGRARGGQDVAWKVASTWSDVIS